MDYNKILRLRLQGKYPILKVKPGYFVEIWEKVGEGDKQRIWKFRGLVIKVKKPNMPDGTFTVRGEVAGVWVEKVYPLSYVNFEKVLLLDEYKVRRAKLYFIRNKVGKAAKLKSIIDREKKGIDLWKEAMERLDSEMKEIEGKLKVNTKVKKEEKIDAKKEEKKSEEKIEEKKDSEKVENNDTKEVEEKTEVNKTEVKEEGKE